MVSLNHTDKEIQSESKSIAQVNIQKMVPVDPNPQLETASGG